MIRYYKHFDFIFNHIIQSYLQLIDFNFNLYSNNNYEPL